MSIKKAIKIRFLMLLPVMLIALWVYGLLKFVENIPRNSQTSYKEADAIVVLTGGSQRLAKGVDLLHEKKAPKLFISGVGENSNKMNLLILSGKLPDNINEMLDDIELGYEAKSTRGNALEVAKWAKNNNVRTINLVTSNYHVTRSLSEFRKYSSELEVFIVPVFPEEVKIENWWQHGNSKKLLIVEYLKYIASILNFISI